MKTEQEDRFRAAALTEQRDQYLELFDRAPIAYVTLDRAGALHAVNLAAAALLGGLSRGHLTGRRLGGFVVDGDRVRLMEHLRRCGRGYQPVTSEVRLHGDLAPIPVQLSSGGLPGSRIFPTAILDMRQHEKAAEERVRLQEAEQTARAATEAKDQFIAALSHELRTPLTPVMAAITALQRRADVPPQLRPVYEMIGRNIAAEARLIDDLLDVTRIVRGKLALVLEPTDVHQAAREAVEMLRGEIDDKGHAIVMALDAEHRHAKADPVRLRQVFWNLVRNAVKFTPPGGRIEVRSWSHERRLAIEVSDSGPGFEPDVEARLFQPFEQGPDSPPRSGGLGLGLAICRGVMELHGGRISATSAGRGRGARFVVELDTVNAPEVAVHAPVPETPAPERMDRRRILLVEDHRDTAETLVELLGEAGYEVSMAMSAKAALETDVEAVDLVVSDIGLPDASGLDLMRQLRARRPILGIALSGYGTEADVRASVEAGFSAHLTKPVDIDGLLAKIREVSGAAP